jgi:DNA-binding NtrC family response regulator
MQPKDARQRPRILIVDDEASARESLEIVLEDQYDIVATGDGMQALRIVREKPVDVVLLDITMPKVSGLQILERIKQFNETIEVVMVSALDRAHEATAAMKHGAFDYVTKPFDADALMNVVAAALRKRDSRSCAYFAHRGSVHHFGDIQILSESRRMEAVFDLVRKVAQAHSSILITGESGTGKELVARAIHAASSRAAKPFVAINCAAIPAELMESELFGHEKGSFTGAHARTMGKFEFAHGGTLFLDEIPSLKLELQAKLLRVLQEREFTRVGSHQPLKVDVRVVAATNLRLDHLVKVGQFRNDLYFRLNVIPIEIPPLRQREEDIPLLSDFFLRRFNRSLGKKVQGITSEAMKLLKSYPWPGNVRELENVIERLVVLGPDGQWVEESDLPFDLLVADATAAEGRLDEADAVDQGLIRARNDFERQFILRVLERCQWNQTDAARCLKIHRNTLLSKMRTLNLRDEEGGPRDSGKRGDQNSDDGLSRP